MAATDVRLNHISRESPNIARLAAFYEEVLGFERIEAPNFGDIEVIWLRISPELSLHLIQRDPQSKLPEGPYGAPPGSFVTDPKLLPRGHHICFSVSNFDDFVQSLKDKGIETFLTRQPEGKTKQLFFFDVDGNGLEVVNREN
ncbi:hypothetical protein HPP92_016787 [Vanilla planifolia]|uniref:VOC domain-containing protein n=1 Tax=Vanilla planifolia TaxID=51239 RepID=A0A835UUJ3_VANPL|nr:hypothetical protein HPP92_016787 [Vanilla planifolia]